MCNRVDFGATVSKLLLGASLALCAFVLNACQSEDGLYLRHGPDIELAATDTVQVAAAQNRYFQYLCGQIGLPSPCVMPVIDSTTWTLIVYQGMNDIDRRCDAYLQWLDNKKRSNNAWLRQVSDTSAATTAILGAVNPNSAVPLQIVAQSFNLISRSIENYNSRLLYEVESSTVHSVVIRARSDFRLNIEGKVFSTRPNAEYVLREYMRRCMPFAIETQINNLSTLGAQGILPLQENTIYAPPVSNAIIGRALFDSIPREGARGKSTVTPPREADVGALSRDERALQPAQVSAIQRALCVAPENGRFGPQTRQSIVQLKQGLRHSGAQIPGIQGDSTNTLNSSMIDFLQRQASSCVNHEQRYGNAFEKYAYPSAEDVKSFQRSLKACVSNLKSVGVQNPPPITETGKFDADTRAAIKWTRHEAGARGIAVKDGSDLAAEDLQVGMSLCLNLQPTIR